MNKIKIDKQKLLAALTQNREKHVREYNEAMAGYRKQLLPLLKEAIKSVHNEENVKLDAMTELERPSSYEKEYLTGIEALNYSVEDTMELTQAEFENYVMDEWAWKEHFAASNMKYRGR